MRGIKFTVILMACLALAWAPGRAQSSGIVIHKPAGLDRLMDFYTEQRRAVEETPGYRIQILAGTSRDKAYKTESDFKRANPGFPVYLTYNSPYFKIRVGDFTNRLTAYRNLMELRAVYPGSFLVEEAVRAPLAQ